MSTNGRCVVIDDIVTRLRDVGFSLGFYGNAGQNRVTVFQAADEIERLRAERLDWFHVARQFRDVVLEVGNIENALDEYLRVRGRLEDPRDCQQEVSGD